MAGISSNAANGLENKKKYNGIDWENDLELSVYDAFYRELDPQTGRWWEIDPEIENMEQWSPYTSNFDNPIKNSDPLGDEPDGGDDPPTKSFFAKAGDFFSGFGNGIVSGAKGLYNFTTDDAWKGETWSSMAKTLTVLAVVTNSGANQQAASGMLSFADSKLGTDLLETQVAITEASEKLIKNVPNMSAKDWGKASGEVLFAVAGTKGLNTLKEFGIVSKGIQAAKELARDSKLIGTGSKLFGNGIGKNIKGSLNTREFRVGWGKHKGNDIFRVGVGNNPKYYPPTIIFGKQVHKHIDIIKVKKTR